jgi:hypothetical protein
MEFLWARLPFGQRSDTLTTSPMPFITRNTVIVMERSGRAWPARIGPIVLSWDGQTLFAARPGVETVLSTAVRGVVIPAGRPATIEIPVRGGVQ